MPLWRSSRAKISTGAVFRSIDCWGTLESTALSPQAVNLILKKRARLAGLDAVELSAHGLRSGYLTETARRGIPLVEAIAVPPLRAAGCELRQRGRTPARASGAGHLTSPSRATRKKCDRGVRARTGELYQPALSVMHWPSRGGSWA